MVELNKDFPMKKYLLIFALLLTPLASHAAFTPTATEPLITSSYVSPLSPEFSQPYASFKIFGGKLSFKTGTFKLGLAVPVPIANLTNSLRLRSSASGYLSRTFGSPTNNKIFTWAGWVKRGASGGYPALLAAPSTTDEFIFNDVANGPIQYYNNAGVDSNLVTTQVFRDNSAWYHLVLAVDTTQATAANRVKIYANGVQITAFSTANYPAQNYVQGFNSAVSHNIGKATGANYLDGYLSDVYFVDGQALTATRFGQYDSNGVWVPRAYTGTYGTNGFHLDFKDAAQTVASNVGLGKDVSGNSNYWVTNNISTTAGVTYDSMVDTPTNNYATLNPIDADAYGTGTPTWSYGNLNWTSSGVGSTPEMSRATIAVSSGKWYWEDKIGAETGSYPAVGVVSADAAINVTGSNFGPSVSTSIGYEADGQKCVAGVRSAYGSNPANGDIVGVALDCDANQVTFYLNNVSQGAISIPSGTKYAPAFSSYGGTTHELNFGQRPFTYTPPTGFVALSTANLPAVTIPNPKKHFGILRHTGNGTTQNVIGTLFRPDFAWLKTRSNAYSNALVDIVRGAIKQLQSDTAVTEFTGGVASFLSNGISINNNYNENNSGMTYVDWLWKANNATTTNTAGSITSTVSANQTAGFSIVAFTTTASSGTATVGHGLNATPKLIIMKNREQSYNWEIYHADVTSSSGRLIFTTSAKLTDASPWNQGSTPPSTTLFGYDQTWNGNSGEDIIAYVWSEVPGYSKFGSYEANNSSDGVYVYCGFRPRWLLIKRSSTGTNSWVIVDTVRNTYNVTDNALYPNQSYEENGTLGTEPIDITANGFKIRTANSEVNGTGTYIYAAFAEYPFGGSNVSPSPAR